MERKVLFSLGAALCISAAFANVIPLERVAWECVNPLGGDFTNGTYVTWLRLTKSPLFLQI